MSIKIRYGFIAALILYWPFIFFLAHVSELPGWIIRTHMSDKAMHYLGYLFLVFLWWFAIFPQRKPSLRSWPFWFTVVMLAFYAMCDELLQAYTHRTPDIWDWAADMSGVLSGILIFALAGLRLSAFAVTTFLIIVLTSLCKTDPLGFVPFLDILFYIGSYCLLTLLWFGYLRNQNAGFGLNQLLVSALVPVLILVVSSIIASIMRKHFAADRVAAAIAGIMLGMLLGSLAHFWQASRKVAA